MKLDEFLARCLAARKLKRIQDPYGIQLPFEKWRQTLPDAEFIVGALMAFDLQQTVSRYYESEEDEE